MSVRILFLRADVRSSSARRAVLQREGDGWSETQHCPETVIEVVEQDRR